MTSTGQRIFCELMMNIELTFRRVVVQDELIARGSRVVLAVSGGVDSMVMLHLFAHFKDAAGFDLTVAHVNHGLRGEASESDEKLVREVAGESGLPFFSTRWHYDGSGNMQDRARRFRQDFLIEVAGERGARYVATGHHRDDQAETVLMHLIRGAGLKGLSGIPWRAEFSEGIQLVRPLLGVGRREIEEYARERGIAFAEDASNATDAYARNDLRHRLIPMMEEFNSRIVANLAGLADRLRDDEDALDGAAQDFCRRELTEEGEGVAISRTALCALMPALRRRVLIRAYERVAGSRADLSSDHIEKMDYLATNGTDQGEYALPGGHAFQRNYNRLKIS
jgi:tRNA(Ile)-lysidine synthase